jgi:hypothetical protein
MRVSGTRAAPRMPHHPAWQPGQAEIAAFGGADRRSAQDRGRADRSIALSAPPGLAAPLPPRGDVTWTDAGTRERRGTPPPRVGNDVGVDVGNDVGVRPPGPRAARDRNDKAAELASEAARAEGASPPPPPTVAGEAWSRAGRQGRLSTPWGAARRRGAGHSPLTAGHRAPSAPRAFRRAWWPACRGETSHGLQPSSSRSDVNAGGRYAQAYAIWAMAARRVGGADYRVVPQGRTAIRRASCWPRARMQVA